MINLPVLANISDPLYMFIFAKLTLVNVRGSWFLVLYTFVEIFECLSEISYLGKPFTWKITV